MSGRLVEAPRGQNGFGYDPLFVAEGNTVTNAELDPSAKDAISHRGQAVRAIVPVLIEELSRLTSSGQEGCALKTYLDLLDHVLTNGTRKEDRTGTGTLSVFGHQMRFDLERGFPLLTTKRVHTRSVIAELLWFISGSTNVKWLHGQGVTIWD